MNHLSLILMTLLLLSCGKEDPREKTKEEEVIRIDGSNVWGVYETPLTALNFNTTLGTIGSAGLRRSSDSFKAFVKLYIGEKGVTHRQSIHQGTRCPTRDDDINSDGFLDQREVHFVVGNVILPLDGDLGSQDEGRGYYPQGNGIAGGYFYERTTSFTRMFEDLRDPDLNTLDEVDKIPYDQGVSFHKRVIVIYGVGTLTHLPESMDSTADMNKHQALPIARGVFLRSGNFPSELYDRSDPLTRSTHPSRILINPRTPPHREPDVIVIPEPDPHRRRGIRQRLRRWWRRIITESERASQSIFPIQVLCGLPPPLKGERISPPGSE